MADILTECRRGRVRLECGCGLWRGWLTAGARTVGAVGAAKADAGVGAAGGSEPDIAC